MKSGKNWFLKTADGVEEDQKSCHKKKRPRIQIKHTTKTMAAKAFRHTASAQKGVVFQQRRKFKGNFIFKFELNAPLTTLYVNAEKNRSVSQYSQRN